MNKQVKMSDVFPHVKYNKDYYTDEYKKTWINDFDLLNRITKDCSKEEVQKIYDMINGELHEIMDMIFYILNNK